MDRRKFGFSILASGVLAGCSIPKARSKKYSLSVTGENLFLACEGVEKPSKIMVIGDAHISYDKGLEEPYLGYAARMHNASKKRPKKEALAAALNRAGKEKYDLVLILGDLINFPSEYNIKTVCECMKASPVPCRYISGNHDWHFEGIGPETPQVEIHNKWIEKLSPLYFGRNPYCYSEVVNGLKFILLDDSANSISREQLDFVRRELDEGLPSIFCVHIPFYFEGRGLGFACGNPNWGEKTDRVYKIERRHKNPPKQPDENFELRNLLMENPNAIGVLAGHTHRKTEDYSGGKFQVVTPAFFQKQQFLTLNVVPV